MFYLSLLIARQMSLLAVGIAAEYLHSMKGEVYR